MTKGNILYLSYDGLTDPLGQSQVLPYLTGLAREGYRITIISFEKPERFDKERNGIKEICDKYQLTWKPLPYHKSPPIFSTLYDLFQLRKLAIRLHRQEQFRIIHCRSYITSLVGLMMKKRFSIKFIFDMRGFWADERVEGGLWDLRNPLFRIVYTYFKKKEKEFLTEADQVISLTESAKSEILSWKLKTVPIAVIPTCVDLGLFNPKLIIQEDQEKLRKQLSIKSEDFVLLYLGSWGTWYLITEMLAFFSKLKKQRHGVKFLIVSQDRIELENYPDKRDVIIAQAPRHLVPLYISLASASVFFIRPSFSKKASSATKMGEIMAMNVPVITNKDWGDVELIFSDLTSGYSVSDLSDLTFNDSLSWIKNGFVESRNRAISLFDLEAGIASYNKIYIDLLKPNK